MYLFCFFKHSVSKCLWVLTDVGRCCGEGVAVVVPAALDEEAREHGVTLLPVDALGEATPLLNAVQMRVEADVSPAGLIRACALIILARAVQVPLLGV